MSQQVSLKLFESEKAVFRGACEIYAGFLAAGLVKADNEEQLKEKAIQTAVSLAKRVDDLVQSDAEMPRTSGGDLNL